MENEYISVKEAAEKWGVSKNYVQRVCLSGRVEGAVKISGIWAVPKNAEKPSNISNTEEKNKKSEERRKKAAAEIKSAENTEEERTVMPLMNTPYKPGSALDCANAIEDEGMRNIALAEYYYFSGRPAKASDITEVYLLDSDLALQLSACLIYAYSNLALDRIPRAKQAMAQIRTAADAAENTPPDTDFMLRV